MNRVAVDTPREGELGTTMAEFAVIASLFFVMIFAIIECGRLFYTHNALTDAARRGARYAALNSENVTCVRNVVIYGATNIGPRPGCAPTGQPLLGGLTRPEVTITVTYEGADLDNNPSDPVPIDTAYGMNLGTATVSVTGYTFTLGIPFIPKTFTLPEYVTTLTAESAGTEPAPIK
jgi:Flp pilus assembly protein TadG